MKRFIKYLIVTIFLFPIIVSAKVSDNSGYKNLCERTVENNYGVNKKWSMNETKNNYALNTPCVDANDLIYDFSDILTEEEEVELKQKFLNYKEKYNMDVVFLSYNLPYSYDSLNEDFEADFYDFNDFGIKYKNYDGIILFRNTYEADPYYQVLTFGNTQMYIYDTRLSDIEDKLYYNIHNEKYYDAIIELLGYVDKYYNEGQLKGYKVDANGYLIKIYYPNYLLYSIIAFVISLIVILILKSKHRMVKIARDANKYFDSKSFNLTNKEDRFITSRTSSYTISSSSSGGGGGHSSSGGHSGGGHSSGGGRHG